VDRLGTFCLLLALALAIYGAVASVWGVRKDRPLFVESARTTAYSLFGVMVAANGAMLAALLANDVHLRYVAENSSRETPTFFKVLSLWSADDGSLLLWNLILAGFIAAVAYRFRKRKPDTLPYAMATLFAIQAFYLALVSGPSKPFAALAFTPPDGQGPLPLLQNHPLMAVHPPFLYLGFIGLSVPFAFAIATLVRGGASDDWIRLTRRWALAAWCFLTVGLLLGALWSYGVLGWGGYWAWDPVENVALLPWLVTTAFLHSLVIQERRGMLRVWNLSLVVGAFALTTFGTFLTRGSILESVHTFARTAVGPMYLAFLVVILAGGFGLIAARASRLRSEGRLDATLSREAAFLGNNLALLGVTLIVLLGTIFPLIVEATSDRQVSVGGPYFRTTTAPVLLLLLFLMAVGPLLSWRRTSGEQLVRRLAVPATAGAAVILGLAAAGVRNVAAVAAFGLAAFVLLANASGLVRMVGSFARAHQRSALGAIPAAAARNRRLAGGLVVHIGVAVAAIGITASTSFAKHAEATLARGDSTTFQGYTLTYRDARTLHQPQRIVEVVDVDVARGGRRVGTLTPSLNLYPNSSEPIGTPSVDYGIVHDLYSSLVGVEGGGRRATFRFFLNPGVTWLWIGGAVMALGGLFALWPGRRRAHAPPPAHATARELTAVRS
jgi:cytochrome c-type biogenesis protein CcmF